MQPDDVKGTANLARQTSAYAGLREEYGAAAAEALVSRGLSRRGIDVPAAGVRHWDTVNRAILAGRIDIATVRAEAEERAASAVAALIGTVSGTTRTTPEAQ
ncbi:hypothetical protein [Piscinibacter gummiphilus]|uniref:Uncharacterized protein n=1 Tax=Piscinibacter gummiphilus TaxID=946333 RepID=A0A1W6LGF0_9BURK|nr:hypothetical protein [Piscinibacter gummiphilus]ARN23286.1 hypothetical protein A4W93_27155 [Piscinibacter gummiphilus]ATU67987.1 hypothetical protein CPZ87_27285 [Piscinibacter gummiphilus]GLS97280.1 hypothetical protein GCM10007918_45720 [Piscinibacter gummiphilus]